MYSKQLGRELLLTARRAVHCAFSNENLRLSDKAKKLLLGEPGIFVNIYLKGELRGSFGYLPGTFALSDGIKQAARGAAFKDKRFAALSEAEFTNSKFEVVLFDSPKLLQAKKEGYFRLINPRKHGLVIELGPFRAVQLPKFAAQRGFGARDYLEKTIEKSGLSPQMWQSPNLKVYVFYPRVFPE